MFKHNGVPEGACLAGDAVFPAGENNYAVVCGLLDVPCVHNLPGKFRDGVVHWPFNSMNSLIRDDLSAHTYLSWSDDAVHLDGVWQAVPARGAGNRIVQSVLKFPTLCLLERKFFSKSAISAGR